MEGMSLSRNIHPLLIDHIIENIMEHFIPGSGNESFLLQTRLVCNQWNLITSKGLQNQSDSVISFGKYFHSVQSMENFFKIVENSLVFPLLNFRLCQDIFQPRNEPLVKDFFKKCNPILSSLTIRLDQESSLEAYDAWLPSLSLPRLKTLIYDDRRNLSNAFDKCLLTALLSSSKNIETLSLHQQVQPSTELEDAGVRQEFLHRVCEIIRNSSVPQLQNLQIDLEISDQLLSCLTECIKGIRNLSLCLRKYPDANTRIDPDSLYSLLKSQGETLEILKLFGVCQRNGELDIKFPRLDRLQSFEIHSWDATVPDVHFSKFSNHEFFPNLNTLVLNTWVDEPSWSQFFQDENRKLKRLKLPQELLNPELIKDIAISFRNLKSLELHYSEDALPVFEKIFESLVQLEELKIKENFRGIDKIKSIDSLLTGLSPNVCRRMLRRRDFFSGTLDGKPGMTRLKNLKILDLRDLLKHQARVSEVSGYLVFMKMKNLQRLKIRKCEICHECLIQLSEKFPLDLKEELAQSTQEKIQDSEYYEKSMLNYCTIS